MVATIAARGNAAAAAKYYLHLREEPYYLNSDAPAGEWLGVGATALGLNRKVAAQQFSNLLHGLHPKNGERLVSTGGRKKTRVSGWDIVFSAPKAVSIAWALSSEDARQKILKAHQKAVAHAVRSAEQQYVTCRRGKGGRTKQPVAGIVVATFQHYTSRELDPQLHSHCYVFNAAVRNDQTWGAIVSKPLYNAQKELGSQYRYALSQQLQEIGYEAIEQNGSIRIAGITRDMETQFSKRRSAILKTARQLNLNTPSELEKAALQTRPPKTQISLPSLFASWKSQAQQLGIKIPERKIAGQTSVFGKTEHSAENRFVAAVNRLRAITTVKTRNRTLVSALTVLLNAIQRIVSGKKLVAKTGPDLPEPQQLMK